MSTDLPQSMPPLPSTPPPAGWHNDPSTPHLRRYWDGVQWTPMIRTQGQQRWRTVGTVAKWVGIGWLAIFVLVIIVANV